MTSYTPIHQLDREFRRTSGVSNSENDVELRPVMPSSISFSSNLAGESVKDDAASDLKHLLRTSENELQTAMWRPGFWTQLPVLAILSLFGVLASK